MWYYSFFRLTSDIQDFKSSFKQTVSGGLRAVTQIIGCSASLVMISPQMTLITLLCVPSVVALGSIFGTLLRGISIRAQIQVICQYFLIQQSLYCVLSQGGENNSCSR